jgi:hypothetical protein
MATSGICATVVSNSFVKDEYRNRVSLKPCSDKNLFLVEITELTESDSGVYACGLGKFTDRGKTQKVTLNVHNGRCPYCLLPWLSQLLLRPTIPSPGLDLPATRDHYHISLASNRI